MSKKNNKNQPKKKVETPIEETVEAPIEETVEEPEGNKYKVKSAKDLGFEKRNFYIGNKNCLIVQGAEVDEDFYNQFNDREKKIFFEN